MHIGDDTYIHIYMYNYVYIFAQERERKTLEYMASLIYFCHRNIYVLYLCSCSETILMSEAMYFRADCCEPFSNRASS